MTITPLPAGEDNYMYMLQAGGIAAVVDPTVAAPVLDALAAARARLRWILLTHLHADHTGGAAELQSRTGAVVVAAAPLPGVAATRLVADGETLPLAEGEFQVLTTPGHSDHDISYLLRTPGEADALFCGDTLFVAGCGRASAAGRKALWHSLQRLRALPEPTRVYCGHEYTADNLRFAVSRFPADAAYQQRLQAVRETRSSGGITVPSTLGQERRTNPFLRCRSLEEFSRLRTEKDRF